MEKNERQVKGLWIPIDIWKNKDLTWNEKILFLEIDSFTSKDKDCYISNEYISNLLCISETNANKVLSSLIKKGYVVKTSFDGRRRFIKSALTTTTMQPCQERQPCIVDIDNIPNTYTNNNILNKEDKDKSLSKKEKPLWFSDFNAYRKMVDEAYETLLKDSSFRAQFEKYNHNLDYELCLEKAIETFWGTEDGWNHKKKSKSARIDMVSTLKKNIDKSKVYKNRNGFDKDAYVRDRISELDEKLKEEKLIINGVEYK